LEHIQIQQQLLLQVVVLVVKQSIKIQVNQSHYLLQVEILPQHFHLDPRLLVEAVEVVVDPLILEDQLYIIPQKGVHLVEVEMDIHHKLEQTATIIHQLLLFILLLHQDKEMMVDHPLEELLILEQVVVDQVQLENPTQHQLADMVERELNSPLHSEILLQV
jgi:hypothetical protein